MIEGMRNEYRPDSVTPPGEILEEVIQERGMTQAELAVRTGRTRKTISEIIGGKAPITSDTALQLQRALGLRASFWSNLESNYRQCLAREAERGRLAAWTGWAMEFPLKEMVKNRWIGDRTNDPVGKVQELLSFFGVASPEQWEVRDQALQAAFRQSSAFNINPASVAVWLRQGERIAQEIDCMEYDKDRFRAALLEARALTRLSPSQFMPCLREHCADAGVAVVFLKEMPQSRVSGAARWLNPSKALIQLSLRYKRDDVLWFTFFHEAAHILLHAKKKIFLEDDAPGDEKMEREADSFAADWLIPPVQFGAIRSAAVACRGKISADKVKEWARSIGVAPGIVVGRLQHEQLLKHRNLNGLKMRLEWEP